MSKLYLVRWYDVISACMKEAGPYPFHKAIKWAQKLYVNPDVEAISVLEEGAA